VATVGAVLPEHEVVVIDEAHQLEEVISATSGTEIASGRFVALGRNTRAILTDDSLVDGLEAAGAVLADELRDLVGQRLRSIPSSLGDALAIARERADRVLAGVRNVPTDGP